MVKITPWCCCFVLSNMIVLVVELLKEATFPTYKECSSTTYLIGLKFPDLIDLRVNHPKSRGLRFALEVNSIFFVKSFSSKRINSDVSCIENTFFHI